MMVRLHIVLSQSLIGLLLTEPTTVTVTDALTTYAVVIIRVKVSCITSVDGIDLIGQLSCDVIGRLSVKP